ncbi:type III pantothenate kinase [Gordonibacter sp. An230]|uniref:type III pantothenate kinase n=1 Tax=Gordonibacter sp. An230 TaxID=1965592 RepID=UPI000B3AAF6C|nr:type III pantothenate kinase [Gordonibacter sp. An230]OUO88934.1 type III pantothenate kinase [Gordonibacter sp. An230]
MAKREASAAPAVRAVLAIDVGNTTTSLGIVEGGQLVATWSLTTPERMTADEARVAAMSFLGATDGAREVDDAIVASVVPGLTDAWTAASGALCGRRPLVVGPGLKTGVPMRYNDPGELGADRVADLAAARQSYKPPFVVVDLGTTTNFEVVDADGVFVGGIIAPGLALSARALADAAAKLAVVDLRAPASVIGKSTREAVQAGVVMGEVARIDGLIDMIWRELGRETLVVATGADAQTMRALSARIDEADEHLTLRGLGVLHALNRR